jgi:predicted nucleotidyltransferase component of viral defense system
MAKILNRLQEDIFKIVWDNKYIRENFYFSWGTALSEFYLQHRESVDLDFFSDHPFDRSVILDIASELENAKIKVAPIKKIHDRYTFEVSGNDWAVCILDFCFYNFPRLEKTGKFFQWIEVDSIRDIVTNKWCTLFERNEPKDILDIICLSELKHTPTSDEHLGNVATDLKKKFWLAVWISTLKQQFRDKLKLTNAIWKKGLLYTKVENFNLFPKEPYSFGNENNKPLSGGMRL